MRPGEGGTLRGKKEVRMRPGPNYPSPGWLFVVPGIGALIVVVIFAVAFARDDSSSQILTSPSAATTPPTVWSGAMNLPPELTTITAAAETTTTATRSGQQIQLTEPPPRPFDPVAYVNSLAYCHACMDPAMEAYRMVAAHRGWSEQQVESRSAFVRIIMATESGGCPNVRRWGYGSVGQDCRTLCMGGRKGECAYDDAGFGQVTQILRTPTSPLCAIEGICSAEATVASPWASMTAFLRVLEDGGNRPYCYLNNFHVRDGHCRLWPG